MYILHSGGQIRDKVEPSYTGLYNSHPSIKQFSKPVLHIYNPMESRITKERKILFHSDAGVYVSVVCSV